VFRKIPQLVPVLVLFLIAISSLSAQDLPDAPNPPRLVTDLVGILSSDQVQALETRLVAFNDSTSTQIAVVIVPSLHRYDPADYTYRLAEKWGVGQKGKNNGVMVMIKPKTAGEAGQAFIAPGYGLEAVIPDALCKRIVTNEMIPRFREGDYYGGINAAVTGLMGLASGEFTADQYGKRMTKEPPYGMAIPIVIFILVFFLIRMSRARSYSVGKSIPFWTAFWLLGSMGRGHSGNWNNFTSGSGGFGGFGSGGGGFGGFGGGSFGGGGAGGSW
jgi:uncharacterized protein